jgi:hypothetical protein
VSVDRCDAVLVDVNSAADFLPTIAAQPRRGGGTRSIHPEGHLQSWPAARRHARPITRGSYQTQSGPGVAAPSAAGRTASTLLAAARRLSRSASTVWCSASRSSKRTGLGRRDRRSARGTSGDRRDGSARPLPPPCHGGRVSAGSDMGACAEQGLQLVDSRWRVSRRVLVSQSSPMRPPSCEPVPSQFARHRQLTCGLTR